MENQKTEEYSKDIKQDPFIKGLLDRIPEKTRDTFSDEQLSCLKIAMGAQRGQKHPVDIRGRLNMKFRRYYYVFLAGKDRRQLSRQEKRQARLAKFLLGSAFLIFSTLLGWLVLYLAQAAFGIDLMPSAVFESWNFLKRPV